MYTANVVPARPTTVGAIRVGQVAVGHGPIADLALADDRLVATNYGSDSVSFVDAEAERVVATVAVDGEPSAVTVANRGVYVATAGASFDRVSVLDRSAQTLAGDVPMDLDVTAVAVAGRRVFAAGTGRSGAELAYFDVKTKVVGSMDVLRGQAVSVNAMRVSSNGRVLCVAASGVTDGRLALIDTDTMRVIGTVAIGSPIRDVALVPDGSAAHVLTDDPRHGGAIDIVDLLSGKVVAHQPIGGAPVQIALSPDTTRAYVVDQEHVSVICTVTNQTVEAIAVADGPSCVVTSADGSRLYVADYAGNVTTFAVAAAPQAVEVGTTEAIEVQQPRELVSAGS